MRKDWDIALCGELIRTNSGTSGVGEGGIIAIDEDYESVAIAPDTLYAIDSHYE